MYRRTEGLTPRQAELLTCYRDGLTIKETARQLGVAEATIKGTTTAILQRLHVSDRTQAVVKAIKLGLIPLE